MGCTEYLLSHPILSLFLWVCMLVCMRVHVCAHMCVWMCMWKPEEFTTKARLAGLQGLRTTCFCLLVVRHCAWPCHVVTGDMNSGPQVAKGVLSWLRLVLREQQMVAVTLLTSGHRPTSLHAGPVLYHWKSLYTQCLLITFIPVCVMQFVFMH